MNTKYTWVLLVTGLAGLCLASANDIASNTFYVSAAAHGTCYAKSIPSDHYGTKGRTQIFGATETTDNLLFTFDWYSQNLYLQGIYWGISVVRFGPPHGLDYRMSSNDLAIAFYMNDKLLKTYSTLDIAGLATNEVSRVSEYNRFMKIKGYRWIKSNDYAFDVTMGNGKELSFDVRTGEIMK
jgi:hypothetical protein